MKKRVLGLLLAFVLMFAVTFPLTACGGGGDKGKAADNKAIGDAEAAINALAFVGWAQSVANTEEDAKTQIRNQINAKIANFGDYGVTVAVNAVTFKSASAGSSAIIGTNGSFKFTVTVSRGKGTEVTSNEKTVAIEATKHVVPVDLFLMAITNPRGNFTTTYERFNSGDPDRDYVMEVEVNDEISYGKGVSDDYDGYVTYTAS